MSFFLTDSTPTVIYTLSLHDALPISAEPYLPGDLVPERGREPAARAALGASLAHAEPALQDPRRLHHHHVQQGRSEEHTSELQSRLHLVCRLLLEKKK